MKPLMFVVETSMSSSDPLKFSTTSANEYIDNIYGFGFIEVVEICGICAYFHNIVSCGYYIFEGHFIVFKDMFFIKFCLHV